MNVGINQFITWVFSSFFGVIFNLTDNTVSIINDILEDILGETLWDIEVNLVLFSDTPILATSFYSLLTIFFSIFYTVILIVIVWKIIKKVVVKITGWKRW